MQWKSALAAGVAPLVLVADLADAQDGPTVELGALGRFGTFGDGIELESTGGVGARLGIFFLRDLAAEIELGYAEPDLTLPAERTWGSHQLFAARLVHNLPVTERLRVLTGAGYTYDNYRRTPPGATADGHGIGALGGVRWGLTERLSLRAEGTAHYVVSSDDAVDANPFNLGLQVGASVFFFDRERIREVELPAPPPDTVLVERERPRGEPVALCLATGEEVTVEITAQGDTLVGPQGTRIQDLRPGVVFAGSYAAGRSWFEEDEAVELAGPGEEVLEYRRTGGEVELECAPIARVGEHGGVPVFADAEEEEPWGRVYVPVRPGLWQPYEPETEGSGP